MGRRGAFLNSMGIFGTKKHENIKKRIHTRIQIIKLQNQQKFNKSIIKYCGLVSIETCVPVCETCIETSIETCGTSNYFK